MQAVQVEDVAMPHKFDVHFGAPGRTDHRKSLVPDTSPDDDEELAETPADVVGILGFDPKEFSKDEEFTKDDPPSAELPGEHGAVQVLPQDADETRPDAPPAPAKRRPDKGE